MSFGGVFSTTFSCKNRIFDPKKKKSHNTTTSISIEKIGWIINCII